MFVDRCSTVVQGVQLTLSKISIFFYRTFCQRIVLLPPTYRHHLRLFCLVPHWFLVYITYPFPCTVNAFDACYTAISGFSGVVGRSLSWASLSHRWSFFSDEYLYHDEMNLVMHACRFYVEMAGACGNDIRAWLLS